MDKKEVETTEKKPVVLQPIEELTGVDSSVSDAFVCDVETGVCGPIKKEKGKNE